MIHKYPYTDFHELNLDWFLRQFKELKNNWDALLEENATFKETLEREFGDLQHNFDSLENTVNTFTLFVTNYFDNLDVQTEINNKLNDMAADGTLGALLEPFVNNAVPGAVEAWLNANVDPVGSAVTIDKSLTLGGSAADAKIVGQLRDGFNASLTPLTFTPAITADSYIKQDGTGVGSSNKYCRMSALYTGFGMRVCIIVDNPAYESQISFYNDNGVISTGVGFLGYDGYNAGPHYIPATAKKFACNFRRVDQAALTAADRSAISAGLKAFSATDTSLSLPAMAADSKTVGEALNKAAELNANIQFHDVTDIYSVSWAINKLLRYDTGATMSNSGNPSNFCSTNFIPCSAAEPLRVHMQSGYHYRAYFYSDNLGTFVGPQDASQDGTVTTTYDGYLNGTPYTYVRFNISRDDGQHTQADFEQCVAAFHFLSPHPYGIRRTKTSNYNHFTVDINLDWPDVSSTASTDAESLNVANLTCVLALPITYSVSGAPVPIIMMGHGYPGHVTDSSWYQSGNANFTALVDNFVNNGFAVFDVDNTRANANGWMDWGCLPLMSAYRKAWDYIRKNFNVQNQMMIYSFSMGTPAALNFAKWWPDEVKCALHAAPRPVCKARYTSLPAGTDRDEMDAAFAIATPGTWNDDRLRAFSHWENIIDIGGTKYAPAQMPPTKVIVGQSDTWLTETREYYAALRNSGSYVNYREVAGFDHNNTCFLTTAGLKEEAIRWFNRYMY